MGMLIYERVGRLPPEIDSLKAVAHWATRKPEIVQEVSCGLEDARMIALRQSSWRVTAGDDGLAADS